MPPNMCSPEDIKAHYADLKARGATGLRSTDWEGMHSLDEMMAEDLARLERSGPYRVLSLVGETK